MFNLLTVFYVQRGVQKSRLDPKLLEGNNLVEYRSAVEQLPDKEQLLRDQEAELAASEAQQRDHPRDKKLRKLTGALRSQVAETRARCAEWRSKIAAVEEQTGKTDGPSSRSCPRRC